MNCPDCGAWSEVKDTRKGAFGINRRRLCANGHRFTSIEVFADVIRQSEYFDRLQQARATLRSKGYLL